MKKSIKNLLLFLLSVKSNGRFFVIQKENYEKDLWVCANFYKEAEYG